MDEEALPAQPTTAQLASRLTRLVGRQCRLASSSSEEDECGASGPHPSAAAATLRRLLEHHTGDLDHLQQHLAMGACLSRPGSSGGGGRDSGWQLAGAPAPALHVPTGGSRAARAQGDAAYTPGSQYTATASGAASPPGTHASLLVPEPLLPSQGGVASSTLALGSAPPGPAQVAEEEGDAEGLHETLRRQAAEDARRQQARAARERDLQQMQLAHARQCIAARRIARAWQLYSAGPVRGRRAAAAARIQAAWRGLRARRAAARLRRRRQLLGLLHAAVDGGDRAGVQEAAGLLDQLGFGADAQQLVEGFEQSASVARQRLQAAAAGGSAPEFNQAQEQAAKFRHLQAEVAEAAAAFSARVEAAEAALLLAAQGGTLVEFHRAADAAAALVVEPGRLCQAEEALAARVQAAVQGLQAAVEAVPFVPDALQAASRQADRLGVHADVARAQLALEQRRGRAGAQLQVLAEQGSAAEIGAAVDEAQLLGLEEGAAAARTRLLQRRNQAERRLRQLIDQGTVGQFEAAASAAAALGVDPAELGACRELFSQRVEEIEAQLEQDSQHGTVAAYRRSRAAAVKLGLEAAVAVADERLECRRQQAGAELAESASAVCSLAAHVRDCCEGSGSGASCPLAGTAGVGGAAAVLEAHLGIARQVCEAVQEKAGAGAEQGRGEGHSAKAGCHPATHSNAENKDRHGASSGSSNGTSCVGVISSAGSDANGGASALTECTIAALVERLCRGQPSAVHQHTLSDNSGGGYSCSLRDVLARFAAAASKAGGLELGQQLAVGCSAFLGQLQVLLSQCKAQSLPQSASLHVQGQQQQRRSTEGARQQQQQWRQQEEEGEGGDDVILQQLQGQSPGAGLPCWPVLQYQEVLVSGFHAWRQLQLASLSPEDLAQLQQQALTVAELPAMEGVGMNCECSRSDGSPSRGTSPSSSRAGSRCCILSSQCGSGEDVSLDVSKQGLESLELLAACTSLRSLDLSTNLLTSLRGLSGLIRLQDLVVTDNQLTCLEGLAPLSSLTRLVADSNPLQDAAPLTGLVSLASLSLQGAELTSLMGCLQRCRQLTSLCLAGNRLAGDLCSLLPPLPHLISLDVSGNQLTSLGGLATRSPLLQTLAASSNPLGAFPADLHLALLRELHLSGCSIASLPSSWPWLPSLRSLQLQSNALRALAPMHGFPALAHLNLSCNLLVAADGSEGMGAARCLAPLAALTSLQLGGNPVAEAPGYPGVVLHAVPWLAELDLRAFSEEERQQHLQHACQQGSPGQEELLQLQGLREAANSLQRPPLPAWDYKVLQQPSQAAQLRVQREADAILWVLSNPHSAAAAASQQAMLSRSLAAGGEGAASCGGGSSSGSWGGAGSGDSRGQSDAGPLAALRGLAAAAAASQLQLAPPQPLAAAGGTGAGADCKISQLQLVQQLAQQYALLLTFDPSTQLQGGLLASPSDQVQQPPALSHHALVIQAAWRGWAARRLRARLAAERAAQRQHDTAVQWQRNTAALRLQAFWRGWAARKRHSHVCQHLGVWREEWRRRQALLELHQQHCAAVQVQAAWRGHRVRQLLRQARAAATRFRPHSTSSSSQDTELLGGSSLEDLLAGCGVGIQGSVEVPERLSPLLGASLGLEGSDDDGLLGGLPAFWPAAAPQGTNATKVPQLGSCPVPAQQLPGAAGAAAQLPPTSTASSPASIGVSRNLHVGTEQGLIAQQAPRVAPGLLLPELSSNSRVVPSGAAHGRGSAAGAGQRSREGSLSDQHLPPLQPAASSPSAQLAALLPALPAAAAAAGVQQEPSVAGAQAASDRQQDGGAQAEEWVFRDDATAAAWHALRKKQAQQAKQRALREQMKDPTARLQLFKQQRPHERSHSSPGKRCVQLPGAPPSLGRPASSSGQLAQQGGSMTGSGDQPASSPGAASGSAGAAKPAGLLPVSAAPPVRRPVLLKQLFPFDF